MERCCSLPVLLLLLLHLRYPQQRPTMAAGQLHLLLLVLGTSAGQAVQAVREAAAGWHQAMKPPQLLPLLQ
jgi:hypothetical protein